MIFVDIENKELLEKYLEDFATWMPYGFGEKGMLGLYPTNEHSEEEIIAELKKYNIPYYTEVTEAVVLTESGNDKADESYKGIFIDRKTGDFKILTGRFPDKKAMINKYGILGKDYIARKVFEKPVFDWILNNAKSSLDSYLMFSTAFSKWRHNSILDKYYIKLINDMPQLFKNVRAQDKIGGDNKAKNADKESAELIEAEYVGSVDDRTGGKIYLVVYGENGVLADFTDSAPIKYNADMYNFDSVELFKWLQKAVDQVEEDTGEKVTGVAVKRRKKDPTPKLYSRDQIEKGFTRDPGKVYSQNNYFQKTLDDPTSEKLTALVYCRDENGKRIIMRPYPTFVNHIIEKGNGIDDRQVWITALQTLNTAGKYDDGDEVFIIDPEDGSEKVANRRSVETNVHNMEPGQDKPILTKKGNIAHPTWGKYKISNDGGLRGAMDTIKNRQKTVIQNMVKQQPINNQAHLSNLGSPEKNYKPVSYSKPRTYGDVKNNYRNNEVSGWRHFESIEEQKEYEMSIREEVKKLVEASGIYDLPDYAADLADPNANNVIRFIVKNMFGKDDIEQVLVNKPISDDVELEDFILPEVEAAAARIKARNPGKKIYVQVNDEKPTEYIDIEEPQE